jgi:hypothetical protein
VDSDEFDVDDAHDELVLDTEERWPIVVQHKRARDLARVDLIDADPDSIDFLRQFQLVRRCNQPCDQRVANACDDTISAPTSAVVRQRPSMSSNTKVVRYGRPYRTDPRASVAAAP